ncbi:hypothetical protein GCM10011506_18360 [Marivirga lumbricoides]|uniref:Potassium channel domain-containing protein n=1 Tax=Marivirga lumbricoides TaxID=1046115 RepID=A0ABQ1M8D9_9BACT|nr:hypothetical protein GCM10011506_18360 [Marivirga lumbricoides]
MNENFSLISGISILAIVMYDFFYTTMSGSGAAMLTRFFSLVSHKIIKLGVKLIGRSIFSYSGLIVNLVVFSAWVMMVWVGLYLVYSSDQASIVSSSGLVATSTERFYFAGYTLSTMGLGDFKPISPSFKILTSIFSFFGFIFFTTAMTYLISVSNAVIHKRSLALAIRNLGTNPEEVAKNLVNKSPSYCYQKFSSLQEMIDTHTVNHEAYPVLHYYGNADYTSSFSINLASLDEAISQILGDITLKDFHLEITPLRSSINHLLLHMEHNFHRTLDKDVAPDFPLPKPNKYLIDPLENDMLLQHRRSIIGGLLKNEGFRWKDVYS